MHVILVVKMSMHQWRRGRGYSLWQGLDWSYNWMPWPPPSIYMGYGAPFFYPYRLTFFNPWYFSSPISVREPPYYPQQPPSQSIQQFPQYRYIQQFSSTLPPFNFAWFFQYTSRRHRLATAAKGLHFPPLTLHFAVNEEFEEWRNLHCLHKQSVDYWLT